MQLHLDSKQNKLHSNSQFEGDTDSDFFSSSQSMDTNSGSLIKPTLSESDNNSLRSSVTSDDDVFTPDTLISLNDHQRNLCRITSPVSSSPNGQMQISHGPRLSLGGPQKSPLIVSRVRPPIDPHRITMSNTSSSKSLSQENFTSLPNTPRPSSLIPSPTSASFSSSTVTLHPHSISPVTDNFSNSSTSRSQTGDHFANLSSQTQSMSNQQTPSSFIQGQRKTKEPANSPFSPSTNKSCPTSESYSQPSTTSKSVVQSPKESYPSIGMSPQSQMPNESYSPSLKSHMTPSPFYSQDSGTPKSEVTSPFARLPVSSVNSSHQEFTQPQTPGSTQTLRSQYNTDPYSRSVSTPRPMNDSYTRSNSSQKQNTPHDPYSYQPGTPRPVNHYSQRDSTTIMNQRSGHILVAQNSNTYLSSVDPYAKQPLTPMPTSQDPYSKQSMTPMPSSQDPYAKQPMTPMSSSQDPYAKQPMTPMPSMQDSYAKQPMTSMPGTQDNEDADPDQHLRDLLQKQRQGAKPIDHPENQSIQMLNVHPSFHNDGFRSPFPPGTITRQRMVLSSDHQGFRHPVDGRNLQFQRVNDPMMMNFSRNKVQIRVIFCHIFKSILLILFYSF